VSLADARAIVRSVPPFVSVVGVMVNPSHAEVQDVLALGCVPQFSGDESPEFCAAAARGRYVKVLHFVHGESYTAASAEAMAALYPDADLQFEPRAGELYGGTGTSFDWPLVAGIAQRRRVIVSGGLNPGNVAAAVASVRPFGVDVRSGVERNGVKDASMMRAFVRAVRDTDERTSLAKT
jgi:phosphoribosylanthranilate isomerase